MGYAEADPSRRPGLLGLAGLFGVYLALAILATYPLALHMTDHVIGISTPPGEAVPPLNIWAMATVLRQLGHDPLHLYEGTAFYPYHDTVTFSEHLFVPALQSAPVVWASGNWVLAYNVTMLLTLATAGFGAYLLAREICGDGAAAFGAGILYAFHTWNVNELVRSQITANQWFPFVVWALLRYVRAPGWRWAMAAGGLYLLQSLSCMYWGLYLPFLVAVVAAYLWWRTRLDWRRMAPLAATLALAAGATLAFVWPYVSVARELGFERPEPFSVPIDRYLQVLPGNLLYSQVLGTALRNQNAAHFLGFVAMGLAILGLVSRRRPEDRGPDLRPLLAALVIGGFLLSLGPEILLGERSLGPGPYALLRRFVPGFRNVRYPERLSIILVLGLSPLVALGLARLRRRLDRSGLVVLSGVLLLEHLAVPQSLSALPGAAHVAEVYRWLRDRSDVSVVAEVPASHMWMERADTLPMYYSTVHGKRTVQGYTGYYPPTYNFIKWRLFHFPDPDSVAFLERFGVDGVVVSPEGGVLPEWARNDPRWDLHGPFAEGHVLLRLHDVHGQGYPPPPDDAASFHEIEREGWQVQASGAGAKRAIDDDLATAWSTEAEQGAGDFYRIRLPRPRNVARLTMTFRTPYCFPMHFKLLGEVDEQSWVELPFDRHATEERLFSILLHHPKDAELVVDLAPEAPRPLRAVRVRITENDAFLMPWMMSEIRLYERAGS
jgi:hypothetical protein